jgi:hypothetical protein
MASKGQELAARDALVRAYRVVACDILAPAKNHWIARIELSRRLEGANIPSEA